MRVTIVDGLTRVSVQAHPIVVLAAISATRLHLGPGAGVCVEGTREALKACGAYETLDGEIAHTAFACREVSV